ncbi:DUF4136 domain-containing protein [Adhaeribacter swui]|uniref:DUF4136 domain-containing protein n=1 Tax=Adhaeribacter swui TaxID=2086471 RepID=A0A7G7GE65_9BACT|nr:DUF4136 domain-containing protein [Adhaeribacter swui]QNF35449.1 DUF4136 domain-containing protein [Adhaeribacter swui]
MNRKLYGIILGLLLLQLSACMNYYDHKVESDYSYSGNFKKYRTFNFIGVKNTEGDSSKFNPFVENAIKSRMEVQGYRFNQNRPDLLVSYKLFYEDLLLKGYNQADITEFIETGRIFDEDEEYDPNIEKREYDPVKYNLKKGTLFIVLIDKKKNRAVWQGYASGVLENTVKNEAYLKSAVRSIFDRYKVFTEGYLQASQQQN